MMLLKKYKRTLWALPFVLSAGGVQAIPVDLGLSLVIDVSGSVNSAEYNLQMDGYANAFRDTAIQSNILSGTNGTIAVNTIFFGSSVYPTSLDSFRFLSTTADINAYADTLDLFSRPGDGSTNVGAGLGRAINLLTSAVSSDSVETTNLVIDVSGDGFANIGSNPQIARDAAAAAGITVNGLAIENSGTSTAITTYYNDNIRTTDGFVVTAGGFEDFDRAVRTKLNIETGGPGGPSTDVPEPGTMALFSLGLLGLAYSRRRALLQ